jgi:hypothetical protein
MKLLLSYFLAKAVWQFYDSEWMQQEWTKETVHFMFEKTSSTPKGIFVNEPFLSTRFDSGIAQVQNDIFRPHIFPKILALGIMFLEIELGIWIEEHRAGQLDPNSEPTANIDHIVAVEVFTNTNWEERMSGAFGDVIAACLTPSDFRQFPNDIQGLRAAFEKHIVNPLQNLYMAAWNSDPEKSIVRAIELEFAPQPLPDIIKETSQISLLSAPSPTPSLVPFLEPSTPPAGIHAHQMQHCLSPTYAPSYMHIPSSQ